MLVLVSVSESLRWAAGEAGWKSLEIRVRGNRIGVMLEKVSAQNRGNIARPRNISHLLDISTIIFTGATDVFRTILRGQQTIPYYLRRMYNR